MTAPRVVPRCGRIGCDMDTYDRRHSHTDAGWAAGDVVVVEPKRPTCPGYAWGSPAGVVQPPTDASPAATIPVLLDSHGPTHVPEDLLTRWHSWSKRPTKAARVPTLPRLSRRHVIDPAFGVVEPELFGANDLD